MTRRYDTITQLRYGPEVMTPLPLAITAPDRLSAAKAHLENDGERLGIDVHISPATGLPAEINGYT
jgi:hypothetical protein